MPNDGDLVTEPELAALAVGALADRNVSRADVARAFEVAPSAVTMALDPARYPTKGHALRRRMLREYAGLGTDGPLFRLRRIESAREETA